MKGFVVVLTPLDESGVQRNKDFLAKTHGRLVVGGKAEIDEKGVLRCKWTFPGFMPESVKNQALKNFTDSVDKAIKDKHNVSYEVEFF